jgi:hypothetical protein
MSNDPLDAFRSKDAIKLVKNDSKQQAKPLPKYQAFDAKDRLKYLEIRLARGVNHAPAYAYLLDVVSDGERGTEISLVFSFMMAEIRGKNLQLVAHSLAKRGCYFIQDFAPNAFTPPEADEPIIESIEIIARK